MPSPGPRRTVGVNDTTLERLRELARMSETTVAEVVRQLVREAYETARTEQTGASK